MGTSRNRQTDRQTDRHADTHTRTHTHTETHADTQTHRQTQEAHADTGKKDTQTQLHIYTAPPGRRRRRPGCSLTRAARRSSRSAANCSTVQHKNGPNRLGLWCTDPIVPSAMSCLQSFETPESLAAQQHIQTHTHTQTHTHIHIHIHIHVHIHTQHTSTHTHKQHTPATHTSTHK